MKTGELAVAAAVLSHTVSYLDNALESAVIHRRNGLSINVAES